ncbi:MAG TPA: type VI secretion system-associated FHA domain protein TagH [Caulobacteraceae bacterium]
MITLRLFRQSDRARQVDERRLETGALTIGRGAQAGWRLEDAENLLSRSHCSIGVVDGIVTLTDLSTNGVFIGEREDRTRPREPVVVQPGEVLKLGGYIIVVGTDDRVPVSTPKTPRQADAPFLRVCEPPGPPLPLAAGAPADPTGHRRHANGALLEAFCAAAHLDISAFADEDPYAIMQRLGAVYQEMIVGLTAVMSERTAVKADYLMDHTTVRTTGNNPFRWANPQRIALDLLRDGQNGFVSGPQAVEASFGDIKKHMLCIFAGLKSALDATLETLSPQAIEARVPAAGLFRDQSRAAWREYATTHRQVQTETQEDADGLVNREFRLGYARRLSELDAASDPQRVS